MSTGFQFSLPAAAVHKAAVGALTASSAITWPVFGELGVPATANGRPQTPPYLTVGVRQLELAEMTLALPAYRLTLALKAWSLAGSAELYAMLELAITELSSTELTVDAGWTIERLLPTSVHFGFTPDPLLYYAEALIQIDIK
jgi:hypothetical protein